MKKLFMLGIVSLAFLSGACTKANGSPEDHSPKWNFVRSPLSNKCYETIAWAQGSGTNAVGFAGMGEVPCSLMEKK